MFNRHLNRHSEDYCCQDDDDFDEPDEPGDQDTPHGNLVEEVHRIATNLKRAAFSSCISGIEVEDEYTTLVKYLWGQLQRLTRKPFIREAVIITSIFLCKNGLFIVYRLAKEANLEIGNL